MVSVTLRQNRRSAGPRSPLDRAAAPLFRDGAKGRGRPFAATADGIYDWSYVRLLLTHGSPEPTTSLLVLPEHTPREIPAARPPSRRRGFEAAREAWRRRAGSSAPGGEDRPDQTDTPAVGDATGLEPEDGRQSLLHDSPAPLVAGLIGVEPTEERLSRSREQAFERFIAYSSELHAAHLVPIPPYFRERLLWLARWLLWVLLCGRVAKPKPLVSHGISGPRHAAPRESASQMAAALDGAHAARNRPVQLRPRSVSPFTTAWEFAFDPDTDTFRFSGATWHPTESRRKASTPTSSKRATPSRSGSAALPMRPFRSTSAAA